MLDRTDQLELLAFIEGELDARQMAALRKRLANEPRALAMLERMCEDRAALRAIGSPELPEDFVARLEPVLARPMLTEPIAEATTSTFNKPGEFRRQHRRQHVRMRWGRLAAAAVLFIGLLVGTWAAVNGLVGTDNGSDRGSIVAVNDMASDEGDVEHSSPDDAVSLALTGTIHHNWPDLSKSRELAAASVVTDRPAPTATSAVSGQQRVTEFAIVMVVKDAGEAEKALAAALISPEVHTALVRNFNFAEARKLAEEWAVANGRRTTGGDAPHVASTSTGDPSPVTADEYNLLAERVRERLNAASPRGTSSMSQPSDTGAQLLGAADQSPSLELQLDLSRRGATHTITVPVSILSAVVERLALTDGATTSLRLLPSIEPGVTEVNTTLLLTDSLSAWLNDGPTVRHAMNRLLKESPDGMAQVPVIVQSDKH